MVAAALRNTAAQDAPTIPRRLRPARPYRAGEFGVRFGRALCALEGKTDILVRAKGRSLFVAECKFWAGPKKPSSTVDQIIGYLSWRDTKSAIFPFNRGRELTKVLAAINPAPVEDSGLG